MLLNLVFLKSNCGKIPQQAPLSVGKLSQVFENDFEFDFHRTLINIWEQFGLETEIISQLIYSNNPFSVDPFSADFTLVRFVKKSKIIHLVRFLLYKFHFSVVFCIQDYY